MQDKNKNTKVVLGVIFVASIAVIIGSMSYAYFSVETGEVKNQELSITSGTMRLTFSDNDSGFNGALNFGESAEKLFILENTGTLPVVGKINFVDMVNTYIEGSLTYKLDYKTSEDSTTWTEVLGKKNVPQSGIPTTKDLSKNIKLPVGAKYYYRLTITLENLEGVDQTADLKAVFLSTFNISEGTKTIYEKAIETVKNGNPDFAVAATTDEGIYALEDDYGISYYYRGASQTNYIKYGKNKDGQDMYWRIIRINGDGSLRIIYDGTQAYANGIANDDRYAKVGQVWNTQWNDAKYVGYMFGGENGTASTSKEQAQRNETSSEVKIAVDTWYKENIVDTGYENNIIDGIFCNDRSIPGTTDWPSDTGLGYGKNATAYGAFVRTGAWISDNVAPKFTCEMKNDAFTVNESDKGNGKLTYPVGLITADEIVAAGSGRNRTRNNSYYLYKPSSYLGWSLSPCNIDINGTTFVSIVHNMGHLNVSNVNDTSGAIAPVINLSADYVEALIGDGTMKNPYRAEGVEP